MKEYISLEWFENMLVSKNIAWDRTNVPTVTKADICLDFYIQAMEMCMKENRPLAVCLQAILEEMDSEK